MALVPFTSMKGVVDAVNIVLVGAKGSGKSNIIKKFADGRFTDTYETTIGVDYNSKIMEVDGKLIKVHLSDTSGNEKFLWAALKDMEKADAFVFVYDVTDEESLIYLQRWLELVNKYSKSTTLPKLLLGNKCDLRHKQVVSSAQAKEFGIPEGMIHFEVSAGLGKNINAAFYILTAEAIRWRHLGSNKPIGKSSSPVTQPGLEEDANGVKIIQNGPEYTHMFKIMLVGAPRSGKTCLRFRFCRDHFNAQYHATAGFDCSTRSLVIDGERIKIQVWDVSGDDLYNQTRRGYYKGADGFIVVYDVSSLKSFHKAEMCLKELNMLASDDCPKVMIGTKCDAKQKREVAFHMAEDFADGWMIPIIEVSAKTGTNVDIGFMKCITALKRQLAPWKRIYNFS